MLRLWIGQTLATSYCQGLPHLTNIKASWAIAVVLFVMYFLFTTVAFTALEAFALPCVWRWGVVTRRYLIFLRNMFPVNYLTCYLISATAETNWISWILVGTFSKFSKDVFLYSVWLFGIILFNCSVSKQTNGKLMILKETVLCKQLIITSLIVFRKKISR